VRFKWQNQKAATKDPEDFVSTIAGYLLQLYMQKRHKETPCSNRKVSFQKNWLLCGILGSGIDTKNMDSDHLQVIGWEKNMFETL
jgi:hypothetical protein